MSSVFEWCDTEDDFVTQLYLCVCEWMEKDTTPGMERINTVKEYAQRFQDGRPCTERQFRDVLYKLKEPLSSLACVQDVHDVVFPKEGRVMYDWMQLDEVARLMVDRMERIVRDGGEAMGVQQVYTVDPTLVQAIDDCLARPIRGGLADVLKAYVDGDHGEDSYAHLFTPRQPSEDEQMAWAMRESLSVCETAMFDQAMLDSLPDEMMMEEPL